MPIEHLLARLNARPNNFMRVGYSTKPDLTDADIAAALGMIHNTLGRELLCHVYWPHGADITAKELDERISLLMWDEYKRLQDVAANAEISYMILRDGYARLGGDYAMQEGVLRGKFNSARNAMWPVDDGHTYAKIRKGVLDELGTNSLCRHCKGHGNIHNGDKVIQCNRCHGTGLATRSERERAKIIKRNVANYHRQWRKVYDWLHEKLNTELLDAEDKFKKAIS